jgi:hypothetical protein
MGEMANPSALYDDGRIVCDEDGITIRWYYLWGGKRVSYNRVRSFATYSLRPIRGQWRIWGSGDLVHWYNLDGNRPNKTRGIELDVGGRCRPCITPDGVDAVVGILAEHVPRTEPQT